jgi:hypothetical protein
MRKLIFYFIISLCTFTISVLVNSLGENAVIPVNIDEAHKPVELITDEIEETCEIHRLLLKSERVERICGEFKGSFKNGGWGHLQVPCENSRKRRMPLEDAQFHFNQVGGTNTWMWWKDYETAKKAQFPHGYDWAYEECKSNGAMCFEIKVCSKCRAAEVTWKRDAVNRSRR